MDFKSVHLISVFLAFVFGVIGVGAGLNALIKSNKESKGIPSELPLGAYVLIDTQDVAVKGGIVSGFCALIALDGLLSILFIVVPACARLNISSRTLLLQSATFLILTLGLCAGLVPFTLHIANHKASVTAYIGPLQIPSFIVNAVENASGVTTVYRDIPYLRLLAILPWFTLLFALIATGISFFGLYRIHHEKKAKTV